MRIVLLLLLCTSVTACGIKRPLIRPSEIPAYEQKRQEKLEKRRIDPVTATPEI